MDSLIEEFQGAVHELNSCGQKSCLLLGQTSQFSYWGETGTGKGLVARLIHDLSNRKKGPFVDVSLAGIPPTLAASEIVGHTKGAFTGAQDRHGLFEAANGGTIVLDEIGEADKDVQALLVSILESGSIRRLGESRRRNVDVRVIAATNREMREAVETGTFRADLCDRIAAITISLPPLREHPADIPLLAANILEKLEWRAFQPERYLQC